MAKKLRTYDMTGNPHYKDFILGYYEARNFLRGKNIKDAKQLYTHTSGDLVWDSKNDNYNLDTLYDEKDSENFNGTKAKMLGISLAFHNLGISLKDALKDNNAETLGADLNNPAQLIRNYQEAANEFNTFNFWDWIVSFFVDNGYDAAKERKNELFDRIVNSHILDGKLPTRNKIRHDEIQALTEDTIESMNYDNFSKNLAAEHEAFNLIQQNFKKEDEKDFDTLDLREFLEKEFENENNINPKVREITENKKAKQELLYGGDFKMIKNKHKNHKREHSNHQEEKNIENNNNKENVSSNKKEVKHNMEINEVKDNMKQSSNQNNAGKSEEKVISKNSAKGKKVYRLHVTYKNKEEKNKIMGGD